VQLDISNNNELQSNVQQPSAIDTGENTITMTKKKRNAASAFESVANLELEDKTAEKLRRKRSAKDVSKAKAARSQTKIYGQLMETRILLQRTLQASLVYNPEQAKALRNDGDDSNNSREAQSDSSILADECENLLAKLLKARRDLADLKEPTEDKKLNPEEILQAEYQSCRQEWTDVLNRRHQDLRLHAGLASSSKTQFRVLDSSFWQQVESTVNHEEMRQRSSANRDKPPTDVFDDSKVYQHMLKDFLVMASLDGGANGNDENASSQAYQRCKSPYLKKQVDRKASKGRKIRYVEIPKLVNFTFPISRVKTSNLDEDEWFQSLFGGSHSMNRQGKSKESNINSIGDATIVSSGDDAEESD